MTQYKVIKYYCCFPGAFQQATQCNTVIMSSLFNISKQRGYNNSLCYYVLCVSCWKASTFGDTKYL